MDIRLLRWKREAVTETLLEFEEAINGSFIVFEPNVLLVRLSEDPSR
jgi:hypothetical protein